MKYTEFINSIIQYRLPETQYINETVKKDQIFIHHTASSANPFGVMEYWQSNVDRIATAFIIGGKTPLNKRWKDGDILQCFQSAKWAWHLGLKASDLVNGGRSSRDMNAKSVGIEICNWGYLTLRNGKFYTYAGSTVPDNEVYEFTTPYRGYKYYQKYTDAQLESTRKLLQYLCDTYQINSKFKGKEIFNIDRRCLMGESGIWTHTSCRKDKFDCFPQPELIQMLESL